MDKNQPANNRYYQFMSTLFTLIFVVLLHLSIIGYNL